MFQVQVLIGKDKGRHGLVNFIIKERNWCYVEGLNCVRIYLAGFIYCHLTKQKLHVFVIHQVILKNPEITYTYTEQYN